MKTHTETLEAEAVVKYSDHVGVPSDVRANLCVHEDCAVHEDGNSPCPVPDTWGGLREWANE